MASFCAVLFPRDIVDEIWDLIESVSKGLIFKLNQFLKIETVPENFPTYFLTFDVLNEKPFKNHWKVNIVYIQ